MKNNSKGQNIIEYILVAVAVVLVLLVILNPQTGLMKRSVETTLNSSVNMIDETSKEIRLSP